MIRVRVIYGQGGKSPWSSGFILFALRLRQLGYDVHDDIDWDQPDEIVADIHAHRNANHALIGYSLGANCTSWVASAGQPIALIAAYDPSGGTRFPPRRATLPNLVKNNVVRCLCYIHKFDPNFISAPLMGRKVEITETWALHGFVQGNEWLHAMTLRALHDVEAPDGVARA